MTLMPIRRKTTRGTVPVGHRERQSLTAHVTDTFEEPLTDQERDELSHLIEEASPEAYLGRCEDVARAVLARHGLPTDLRGVQVAPRKIKIKIKIKNVTAMVADRPHSEEWFAAWIIFYAEAVRQHMERGNPSDAAWAALRLQRHVDFAFFKFGWESDTLRGQAQREATSRGGRATGRGEVHDKWRQMAGEVWKEHPDWSRSDVAHTVAKRIKKTPELAKFCAEPDTIRRRIEKKLARN